ncbi:hypothetical protein [Halovivax cerinus]|uniref:Uncharacterized protein n=1 Tax=Halovivax cerinus TaxID=1487865 RepID=A0ABD5NK53_9EURY|nr:hypothetical protein [Halovivax cerinus]
MRRRQAIKLLGTGTVGGSVLSGTASADITNPGYGGTAPEWEALYDRGDIDIGTRSTLVIDFVSHSRSRGSATWSNLQDLIDHLWDDINTSYLDGIRAYWHTWKYIHTTYDDSDRVGSSEAYQDKAATLRSVSNYSDYTGPFLVQLDAGDVDGGSGTTKFGAGSNDPYDPNNPDHPVAFAEYGTDHRYTMCHELGHCLVNSSVTNVDHDHYLANYVEYYADPPKTTLMGYEVEHFDDGMADYPDFPEEHTDPLDYDRQNEFSCFFDNAMYDTYYDYA